MVGRVNSGTAPIPFDPDDEARRNFLRPSDHDERLEAERLGIEVASARVSTAAAGRITDGARHYALPSDWGQSQLDTGMTGCRPHGPREILSACGGCTTAGRRFRGAVHIVRQINVTWE